MQRFGRCTQRVQTIRIEYRRPKRSQHDRTRGYNVRIHFPQTDLLICTKMMHLLTGRNFQFFQIVTCLSVFFSRIELLVLMSDIIINLITVHEI